MLAAVVSRGPSHPDDSAAAAGLIAIAMDVAMADLTRSPAPAHRRAVAASGCRMSMRIT